MMVIKSKQGGKDLVGSWHTGETMRIPPGRVISFQCDGHELDAVIEAFRAFGIPVMNDAKVLTPVL